MAAEQKYSEDLKLDFKESMGVILPFVKEKVVEQIKCVWFIIAYLVLFQMLVLGLPVIYSLSIGAGIAIVIVGLAFFMEGLRLGLMPLGDIVGSVMPVKFPLAATLTFAFVLGVAATFAEPAITVLKAAGSSVSPDKAPLLYSLLNDYADQLVNCVGIGVGLAVALGVMRFFKGWSLKPLIYIGVTILSTITLFTQFGGVLMEGLPAVKDVIRPVLGLAWDCGAVTTGPVTVPLVLALGIGVCRVVSSGGSSNSGFGVVTLASIFPIMAVLCLSYYHYFQNDYYGQPNYPAEMQAKAAGKIAATQKSAGATSTAELSKYTMNFSDADLKTFQETGKVDGKYEVQYVGGNASLDENGRIVAGGAEIVLKRTGGIAPEPLHEGNWNPALNEIITEKEEGTRDFMLGSERIIIIMANQLEAGVKAILLLCGVMMITLIVFLRKRPRYWDEIFLGLFFAILGMALFLFGIEI